MTLREERSYTEAYLNHGKNPNSIEVRFKDGSTTERIVVEQPVGHPLRRGEGLPAIREKFEHNLARRFASRRQRAILELALDFESLLRTPVHEFTDLLCF